MNHRILIIALDLRSSAMAGSYRVLKLARQLQMIGYKITIACGYCDNPNSQDKSIECFEIACLQAAPFYKRNAVSRIFMKLKSIPDPSVEWSKQLAVWLKPKLTGNKFDLIFASSPPHGIQHAAIELSKTLRIPLIADLRDDFVTNHRFRWMSPLHKRLSMAFEREIVKTSYKIILNTEIVKKRFEERYRNYQNKFITITNGYDDDDFKENENKSGKNAIHDKKVLFYAGGAYNGYAPAVLRKIASEILKQKLEDTWAIISAGPGEWKLNEDSDVWDHKGLLNYREATRLMCQCSLLLILMPPGEKEPSGTIPLKAFWYLRSGLPVLYIGEKGSTTDLLSKFDGTYAISREDMNNCGKWLAENSQTFRNQFFRKNIEQYSFQFLAKRLNLIIRDALQMH